MINENSAIAIIAKKIVPIFYKIFDDEIRLKVKD